jgi:hypothetical protein
VPDAAPVEAAAAAPAPWAEAPPAPEAEQPAEPAAADLAAPAWATPADTSPPQPDAPAETQPDYAPPAFAGPGEPEAPAAQEPPAPEEPVAPAEPEPVAPQANVAPLEESDPVAPPPPPPAYSSTLPDGLRPIGESPHIDYSPAAFDLDSIGRTPVPPPMPPAGPPPGVTPDVVPPEPEAAPPADAQLAFELTLRLADGERMLLGSFATADEAQAGAKAFTDSLRDNEWPTVNGRMIRRDAIVSIDIEHNDAPGWRGSGNRGRQFDA